MATVTPLILTSVVRNQFFDITISVTSGGTINKIICVPNFQDPSINIQTTLSQIRISGNNLTVEYNDYIKYVEEGSSAADGESLGLQEPSVVVGIQNVPSGKSLYEFNQDLKDDVIRTYTVFVEETVLPLSTNTSYTLTQTIRNDWYFGKTFLENYFGIENAA